MNDLLPGLIVAAVTALLIAGIFLWTTRVKKKKIAALRSLCFQRGLSSRCRANAWKKRRKSFPSSNWVRAF